MWPQHHQDRLDFKYKTYLKKYFQEISRNIFIEISRNILSPACNYCNVPESCADLDLHYSSFMWHKLDLSQQMERHYWSETKGHCPRSYCNFSFCDEEYWVTTVLIRYLSYCNYTENHIFMQILRKKSCFLECQNTTTIQCILLGANIQKCFRAAWR